MMYPEPIEPHKLPEAKIPLPVDRQGDKGPVRARGEVAVYEGRGHNGFDLRAYRRSPWMTVRAGVRNMLMESLHYNSNNNVTISNKLGNSSAPRASMTSTTYSSYNTSNNGSGARHFLSYGSSSATPTDTDYDLGTEIANFQASSVSEDTVALQMTVSGSGVYSGTSDTLREIGHFVAMEGTNQFASFYLADHASVGGTALNDGDTVAITYTWSF